MKYQVFDLDFDALPPTLDRKAGYDGACVLLRMGGLPCGQAIVSYADFDAAKPLDEQLARAANSSFWERWTARQIGADPVDPVPARLPSATVAVCTRERAEDLAICLEGLVKLNGAPPIMIVDNAPVTDATRDLVARYPQIRYVVEPRAGLNIARNTALAEAGTEVVAFIDDDAVPDPDWFARIIRNFEDPLVLAATGLTMAVELETDAQIAFQEIGGFVRGFHRVVYDALKVEPFESWQVGAGVNCAVRTSAVGMIGGFDPTLGPGTTSRGGDEFDFFRRILVEGYKIVYDPTSLNWHRHRRTMDELERQIYAYECGYFALLTKAMVFERNPRALMRLGLWFRHQIPSVLRARRKAPGPGVTFRIPVAQASGAMAGPGGYLKARKKVRNG